MDSKFRFLGRSSADAPRNRRWADRKGSGTRLAAYRDGGLFATKFAGKGHWESHLAGDELISHPRRHCDPGNRRRRRAAQVFRAPRRNTGCQSAGCTAPLSLVGGRDLDDRHTLSQRGYRARCRRSADGRVQAGISSRSRRSSRPAHYWQDGSRVSARRLAAAGGSGHRGVFSPAVERSLTAGASVRKAQ